MIRPEKTVHIYWICHVTTTMTNTNVDPRGSGSHDGSSEFISIERNVQFVFKGHAGPSG